MIGRDTFSVLLVAPVLGPPQKNGCHPLPLPFMAVSMIPNTPEYMTFELLKMHAAFVADEIWDFMLEPARILV